MKVQSNNLLTELTLMGIAKENKLNYIQSFQKIGNTVLSFLKQSESP